MNRRVFSHSKGAQVFYLVCAGIFALMVFVGIFLLEEISQRIGLTAIGFLFFVFMAFSYWVNGSYSLTLDKGFLEEKFRATKKRERFSDLVFVDCKATRVPGKHIVFVYNLILTLRGDGEEKIITLRSLCSFMEVVGWIKDVYPNVKFSEQVQLGINRKGI